MSYMRGFCIAIAVIVACGLIAQPAAAQRRVLRPGQATMLDRLETMSPEQRRRVLDRLPPGRRQRIEERLRRYDAMPPAQRERLRRQLSWFRQLPPERQEETRRLFRRLSELPADRRQEVRRAVRMLGQLEENRRQRRMESPGFRSRFNPDEQKMVRDLLQVSLEEEPPEQ
jgi:hypothetical protein